MDYKTPRFCAELSVEQEHVLYLGKYGMRVVQRKLVWELFQAKE
jgi:hypothetical protein